MKKVFILILICGFTAYSQPNTMKLYSLEDCIKIASQQNYDIKLSEARNSNASYQLVQAFGTYLPSIGFNMGYSRTLNPSSAGSVNVGGVIIPTPAQNPNTYSMQAQANWNIFDGFSREASYSAIQNNLEATVENSKFISKSVLKQIYSEYIEVIKASQIVKIRREDLAIASQELDRIKAQFDAGASAITEVYSQEASIGQKEIDLVKAENTMATAKAQLLTTMGLNPTSNVEFDINSIPNFISDEDIKLFRNSINSLNVAVQAAFDNRNDLKSAHFSYSSAEDGIDRAKGGYMPTVSASGGWNWSHNQFDEFSQYGRSFISMNLSIPIFSNFNTDLNVENAKLSLIQADIENKKLEQQIKTDVQTAFLSLESAEKQIDISKRSVKSAELNYTSMKERYNVGAATITELTLANNQYIIAQINRVSGFYDYILAQKQLQYAMGIIR
ncbi:MAG TPA: TolC family protein [Candidatus Kapabacteria bacterium]|nr:TolC family protein [Candidatus Kapabacteria bacterium]